MSFFTKFRVSQVAKLSALPHRMRALAPMHSPSVHLETSMANVQRTGTTPLLDCIPPGSRSVIELDLDVD